MIPNQIDLQFEEFTYFLDNDVSTLHHAIFIVKSARPKIAQVVLIAYITEVVNWTVNCADWPEATK